MFLKLKNTNFINIKPYFINDTDVNKILVSNKFLITFGKQDFKYFIGYKDSEKIRTLCISCPQMGIYKRNFDENIYFSKVFLLNILNFRKSWQYHQNQI